MKKRSGPYLLLVPAVALLLFISVVPLFYEAYLSVFAYNPMTDVTPRFVGAKNFLYIFSTADSRLVLIRTVFFTAAVVAIELVVGVGLAVLTVDRKPSGQRIFRSLLVLPMAMTPVAAGLVWRWLFDPEFGLINYVATALHLPAVFWLGDPRSAIVAIGIIEIWQWTPLVFLMVLAGLTALPEEVLEAARVDGASAWQSLWRIRLPMLKGLLGVILIIRFVDALKLFDVIFVTTEGGPGTATELLSYSIYKVAFRYFDLGRGAAMAWLMLAVVLLLSTRLMNRIAAEEFAQ